MNKKLVKVIALMMIMLLAVVTLAGCGNNSNDLSGLKSYTADEDMTGYKKCSEMEGVEFYYPENYVSRGTSKQPIYTDPEILGASVNLATSTYPSAYSFEEYIDASIEAVKKQMTINGDVEKEYINLNGNKACKITYVASSQGQTMKLSQVVIVKDTKAYALTLGSLENDFEAFTPKMEKMIKSFK